MPPLATELKQYWRVFWVVLCNCLARELAFRGNVCIRVATDIVWHAVTLSFFAVIYSRVPGLDGWSLWELYLFCGTMIVIDGLYMTFFYFNIMRIPSHIRTGGLDAFLLKPVNTRFLLSVQTVNFGGAASILLGAALAGTALYRFQLPILSVHFMVYCLLIINGVLVMYYLLFMAAILSFYFLKTEGFLEGIFQLFQLGMRPDAIYYKGAKFVFTYLFPVLLIVNFPVKHILQQLSCFEVVWALLFTFILHCLCSLFWKSALKRYTGAGC